MYRWQWLILILLQRYLYDHWLICNLGKPTGSRSRFVYLGVLPRARWIAHPWRVWWLHKLCSWNNVLVLRWYCHHHG